jgi:hypothetical protein
VGDRFDPSLIQLRCHRPEHRAAGGGATPVFVHHGGWAYCEAGKLGPDHDFRPTGGLTRREIETGRASGPSGAEPWVRSS